MWLPTEFLNKIFGIKFYSKKKYYYNNYYYLQWFFLHIEMLIYAKLISL
jgi:hypothetical protein